MEAAAAQSDFETYYPLNLEFHRTIVESTGNKMLLAEYLRFVKKMHLFRAKSLVQGGGLAVSNREHREMVDALPSGDVVRPHATTCAHVARATAGPRASRSAARPLTTCTTTNKLHQDPPHTH